MCHSILYQYRLVIYHMLISYAPPTSASLFWFYYSLSAMWADQRTAKCPPAFGIPGGMPPTYPPGLDV